MNLECLNLPKEALLLGVLRETCFIWLDDERVFRLAFLALPEEIERRLFKEDDDGSLDAAPNELPMLNSESKLAEAILLGGWGGRIDTELFSLLVAVPAPKFCSWRRSRYLSTADKLSEDEADGGRGIGIDGCEWFAEASSCSIVALVLFFGEISQSGLLFSLALIEGDCSFFAWFCRLHSSNSALRSFLEYVSLSANSSRKPSKLGLKVWRLDEGRKFWRDVTSWSILLLIVPLYKKTVFLASRCSSCASKHQNFALWPEIRNLLRNQGFILVCKSERNRFFQLKFENLGCHR